MKRTESKHIKMWNARADLDFSRRSSIEAGGGGTTIYGIYSYVPLWRVLFTSSLLWDRVYKSESFGLE